MSLQLTNKVLSELLVSGPCGGGDRTGKPETSSAVGSPDGERNAQELYRAALGPLSICCRGQTVIPAVVLTTIRALLGVKVPALPLFQ